LEQELDGDTDGCGRIRQLDRHRAHLARESPAGCLTVGRLEIVGDQLTVLRRADGTTCNLLHPWFQVRETGNGQQRLTFTTELPTERGERLQLTVERAPNPPEVWQWQGQVQFNDGKNQPTFELRQTGTAWQGHFRDWRAEDLLAWLSPWLDESGQHWLVPLDLRGALPDITVQLDPVAESFTATVQFHELASRSVHRLPGFAGLTGTLTISPDGGRLELDSHQLRIDTAGLLRAPITLDTLKGVLNGQRSAQGWTLDSPGIALANPDLTMQVSGSATLPDEGELALNLRGQYHFQIGGGAALSPVHGDSSGWVGLAGSGAGEWPGDRRRVHLARTAGPVSLRSRRGPA
jgi:hypothetical protein